MIKEYTVLSKVNTPVSFVFSFSVIKSPLTNLVEHQLWYFRNLRFDVTNKQLGSRLWDVSHSLATDRGYKHFSKHPSTPQLRQMFV